MTTSLSREGWRRGFALGIALAFAASLALVGGILGFGAIVVRIWTGPLGDRAISVLAIGPQAEEPGAYWDFAQVDGRSASAAAAARFDDGRWAVWSDPLSRAGETVTIAPIVLGGTKAAITANPRGRECLIVLHLRADGASDCLSPVR